MTDHDPGEGRPSLDEAIAGLPRELAPERDLWPAIAADLQAGRRRAWLQPFAAAAAIGCVAVLGWHLLDGPSQDEPIELVEQPWQERPVQALPYDFIAVEAEYGAAREQLVADLDARLEQLSPESRAAIERSLETIAGALVDLRAALADEPLDPVLRRLLLNLHGQELAVLAQVERSTRVVQDRRMEL
ncbi:MAG: hypothetical protein JJT88_01745 [Gammaproteobacteria bacterium]|nr:hypothetical protein [Gammaproteobacteria bacterium]